MGETSLPIYVVDDDESVRDALEALIRSVGFRVRTFASAQEFLSHSHGDTPGCLVLDVDLPGLSGLDLQQELIKSNNQVPIIFLTGRGDIPMTVRAIKAGALDFLTKPVDDEKLLRVIRQVVSRERLLTRKPKNISPPGYEEIIGKSTALIKIINQVEAVAPSETTVLILGETGTGKELVARAIHKHSPRCSKPFISVNCGAIPQALIASELFGHEKGAFTGALQRRLGRFELAEGGTIFLDEVGDLPEETQLALLRVLQEREFERVGGNHPIQSDVRVIAATNRDLQAAMLSGVFRTDLYYRLNVFPVLLPPLRDRKEDIPLLVEYFVDRYGSRIGRKIKPASEAELNRLCSHPWPGNIRELQNVIERSVIVCDGEDFVVDRSWVPLSPLVPESIGDHLSDKLIAQEREMIQAALAESGGRVAGPNGAAAKLGIPASTLESKIRSLKISKHFFKTA